MPELTPQPKLTRSLPAAPPKCSRPPGPRTSSKTSPTEGTAGVSVLPAVPPRSDAKEAIECNERTQADPSAPRRCTWSSRALPAWPRAGAPSDRSWRRRNKLLRTVYAILRNDHPYHDPDIDYEHLVVERNASRWLRMLRKHNFLEAPARRAETA